jgi:alanyl-tRNA synthetase
LEKLFAQMKKERRALVSGQESQDLYTTYGFPPELQETLAAEHNLQFDWAGFRKAMDEHGIRSGGGQVADVFTHSPIDSIAKTNEPTRFLGYEAMEAEGRVIGIIAQDRLCETMDEIGREQPVVVVLDQTPFYGEAGGQVGDTGELVGDGIRFEVIDTHKEKGFTLHLGHLKQGVLKVNTTLTARVDAARRAGIRRAHSATHILHHALQKFLGSHAQQQGSKVDNDWLRFDFANPSAIDRETLEKIENEVNDLVTRADAVRWDFMPIADARKTGAMMLFGEKYPEVVRVVSMGSFSKELCGGTHVSNTGEVGLVRIVGEESVSAGTRRVTALTGRAALERVRQGEAALAEVAATLRVAPSDVPQRVAALAKEIRDLKKQLAAGKAGGVTADKLLEESEKHNGATAVVAEAAGADAQLMRQMIDQLRKTASPIAVLLASREEDKVTIVAGISRELEQKGLNAGDWIRSAAEVVGGRGGGRPDMAQAGGKHPDKLPQALDAARARIKELLRA